MTDEPETLDLLVATGFKIGDIKIKPVEGCQFIAGTVEIENNSREYSVLNDAYENEMPVSFVRNNMEADTRLRVIEKTKSQNNDECTVFRFSPY